MKLTLLNILNVVTQNSTRVLLGMLFLAYGLNSAFNVFSTPTPPPESHNFLLGLAAAPYLKLSLVILAPIVVNICLFHAFLDHGLYSLIVPSVMLVLYVQLLWQHRKELKYLLER